MASHTSSSQTVWMRCRPPKKSGTKGNEAIERAVLQKTPPSPMMWPGRIGGFETSYRCGFLGIRCVDEAKQAPETTAPEQAK